MASAPSDWARSRRSERARASRSQPDAGPAASTSTAPRGNGTEMPEVARAGDLAVRARLVDLALRGRQVLLLCGGFGHGVRCCRDCSQPPAELERDKAGNPPSLRSCIRRTAGGVDALSRDGVSPPKRFPPPSRTTHEILPTFGPRPGRDGRRGGAAALAEVMVGGAPMYRQQGHRRQRGQLEGPHHAGRGRQGRRPGRHAEGRRPVHRVRADQRRLRRAARRHRRHAAQAREQGDADQGADLPRGRRQDGRGRAREGDRRRRRQGRRSRPSAAAR